MQDSQETLTHHAADFIFDAFYVGAIGGSIVALFFLAIDIGNGQALFTPSLMGSVLFGGAAAANLLAAGGIAGFLVFTHRPLVCQRLKHAVHLA